MLRTVLGLMVVALFAFLGSALYRVQRVGPSLRALVSSGFGFFAIGLALGPLVTGVLNEEALDGLDVLIDLGVGWVGLLFGLQFHRGDLRRWPLRGYLGALTESAVTLLVCAVGLWLTAWATPQLTPAVVMVAAMAAAASTSSPTAAALVRRDLAPRGLVTDSLRLFLSVDAVPAVLVVGALLCFASARPEQHGPVLDGLFWLAVTVGLALALGALFHLLTLYRYSDNQLLVIVLGLVVFCGGAAHYLALSPLFVNFLVGLLVANRSPSRLRLLRVLLALEKPIYLILLTLAGALWQPPIGWWWSVVVAFVLLRLVGKWVGGLGAGMVVGLPRQSWIGLAGSLFSHGGMALVIALSYGQFFEKTASDVLLTAVVLSILVTTLLAPWSLRRTLIRQGEAA